MGEADADVVDHDWLVCEHILVFGGHSTLGKGERMGAGGVGELAVELVQSRLASSSDAFVGGPTCS